MEDMNSMLLYLPHARNVCVLIAQALMRRGLANLEMDRPEEAIKGGCCNIFLFHIDSMSRCRQDMYNVVNLMLALALRL